MDKYFGEQPQTACHAGADASGAQTSANEATTGAQEAVDASTGGSPFGKFKDSTSLLSAYNSLQAEFTRKSQRLAELEKSFALSQKNTALQPETDTSENKAEINESEINFKSQNANALNSANVNANVLNSANVNANVLNGANVNANALNDANANTSEKTQSEAQDAQTPDPVPQYKKANWREKVAAFIAKNPEAKAQAKAMAEVLISDKNLASLDNCLELAFRLSDSKTRKKPEFLATDEGFLKEYIVNNPRAQELIIGNYINSLKAVKTPPVVTTGKTSTIPASPHKKLNSMEEAREMVQKFFR